MKEHNNGELVSIVTERAIEEFKDELRRLRQQNPNDADFGDVVAMLIKKLWNLELYTKSKDEKYIPIKEYKNTN